MSEKEISEALFRLRAEIEALPADDTERRGQLETLLNDLEEKLEASDDPNQLHLVEDLKETVAQFEVEHPRITGILNEIMVMLGNMGI